MALRLTWVVAAHAGELPPSSSREPEAQPRPERQPKAADGASGWDAEDDIVEQLYQEGARDGNSNSAQALKDWDSEDKWADDNDHQSQSRSSTGGADGAQQTADGGVDMIPNAARPLHAVLCAGTPSSAKPPQPAPRRPTGGMREGRGRTSSRRPMKLGAQKLTPSKEDSFEF